MIIYEVNLLVDPEAASEFEAWLEHHIAELLAIEGFTSAEWFESTEVDSERRAYSVQYRLSDRAALESYFANHAERMRADGMARFGGRFTATRRVMELRRGF